MQEGEVFLEKQKIEIEDAGSDFPSDSEEMKEVLRQRTNRKILVILRFNLWAYNLVSDRRVEKSREHKAKRRARRNERRAEKGKKPLDEDWKTKWEWLKYTVGEPPVALDTTKTKKSVEQLDIFLKKRGYFNDSIRYEIRPTHDSTRATVVYTVNPGKAHYIRSLKYDIRDSQIAGRKDFFESTTLLKPGDRFSIEAFDDEREKVTSYLNNRGYYGFTKDFVMFEVDSTAGNYQVDLNIRIRKVREESGDAGQVNSRDHKKFFIGDVYVHTNYSPTDRGYSPDDTLKHEDIMILFDGEPGVKPNLLNYTVFIRKGELYQKDDVESTYRRFNELGIFRAVNIRFDEQIGENGINILDCHIYLTPAKVQGVSLETTGTHRDPSLGIQANLGYRHKNIFKGAEALQFKLHTGFEAQPPVTTEEQVQGEGGESLSRQIVLNTFEIGPEVSLQFHRLFPIKVENLSKTNDPSTTFSAALNFQRRPDYQRTLSTFRWRYRFQETRFKTHVIDPIEFSVIRINKSQLFEDRLNQLNDQFLLSSYQDHLISATGYSFIYNNQEFKYQRKHMWNSVSLELAGSLLRLLHKGLGAEADEDGNYQMFDIQFAQYVKVEDDLRFYRNFKDKNTIVLRLNGGVGLPLNNLDVLPFDRSFFTGGSSGIRAWQARTLGPGSYRDSTAAVTYNNIGEVLIETNIEYRFDLTDLMKIGIFIDAGNIWLLEEDDIRPGSGFNKDRFLSEIAVGTGLGLRFDFDFFLIRLDMGIQLKDPAKVPGERWIWEPKDEYNQYLYDLNPTDPKRYVPRTVFNLGIGYPF